MNKRDKGGVGGREGGEHCNMCAETINPWTKGDQCDGCSKKTFLKGLYEVELFETERMQKGKSQLVQCCLLTKVENIDNWFTTILQQHKPNADGVGTIM